VAPLVRLLLFPCVATWLVILCLATQWLLDILHIPLDLRAGQGPGQFLLYTVVLLGLWLVVRYLWRERLVSFWRTYVAPANRRRVRRGFLLGAITALAASTLGYCVMFKIGGAVFDPGALARLDRGDIIGAVFVAALIPILVVTEEVIFRGFVYNYLRGTEGGALATLVATLGSAFVFAFAHGFRAPVGWLEPDNQLLFVGLLLLGILLAVAYESCESLAVTAGIHSGFLWTKIPRGCKMILLDQKQHWWAGVNNDPRTAPFVWLLFALLIVAVGCWRRRLAAVAAVETAEPSLRSLPAARHRHFLPAGEHLGTGRHLPTA
jgi:membrane protease YdiL (CAAX protease family)